MSASRHKMPAIALLVTTPLSVCLERNATRPHDRHVPEQILRTPTREHRGSSLPGRPGCRGIPHRYVPGTRSPAIPLAVDRIPPVHAPAPNKAGAVTQPARTTDPAVDGCTRPRRATGSSTGRSTRTRRTRRRGAEVLANPPQVPMQLQPHYVHRRGHPHIGAKALRNLSFEEQTEHVIRPGQEGALVNGEPPKRQTMFRSQLHRR